MLQKTLFLLIAVLMLWGMNFADEIVLQNGHEGYEGCTDTHLRSEGDGVNMDFAYQDINFHSDTYLMTAN